MCKHNLLLNKGPYNGLQIEENKEKVTWKNAEYWIAFSSNPHYHLLDVSEDLKHTHSYTFYFIYFTTHPLPYAWQWQIINDAMRTLHLNDRPKNRLTFRTHSQKNTRMTCWTMKMEFYFWNDNTGLLVYLGIFTVNFPEIPDIFFLETTWFFQAFTEKNGYFSRPKYTYK